MAKIKVLDQNMTILKHNEKDYISLTDIANSKDGEQRAADIIKNWIRNRGTLKFIGTWKQLYNPNFKVVESDHFKMSFGLVSRVAISLMNILLSDKSMQKLEGKK